jgi:hypothetical protein
MCKNDGLWRQFLVKTFVQAKSEVSHRCCFAGSKFELLAQNLSVLGSNFEPFAHYTPSQKKSFIG